MVALMLTVIMFQVRSFSATCMVILTAPLGLIGAVPVLLLPLAAAIRGVLLSICRLQLRWVPYYACYLIFNYAGMVGPSV